LFGSTICDGDAQGGFSPPAQEFPVRAPWRATGENEAQLCDHPPYRRSLSL